MAYLGAAPQPGISFSGVQTQSFNGNGSAVEFALSRHVAQATNLEVIVNNVQQSPFDGSYSVVGGYTLVFSEAPSSGTNNIYVVYRDYSVETVTDTGAVRKSGDTITGPVVINSTAHDQFRVTDGTRSLYVDTDTNGVALASGPGRTGPGVYLFSTEGSVNLFTNNTLRVKVDSAGRMTNVFQPAFTAWSISAVGSLSGDIILNTAILNNGNHYNTTTGNFTCPVSGMYCFTFTGFTENNSSGNADIAIRRNGSPVVRTYTSEAVNTYRPFSVHCIISCAANDTVRPHSAISLHANQNAIFSGYLLG